MKYLLVLSLFVIVSCSKDKPVEAEVKTLASEQVKQINVTESESSDETKALDSNDTNLKSGQESWGVPFKAQKLVASNLSKEEEKASAAVALVKGVDGSAGSGFFISSDGLFLTNHHVINDKLCEAQGCRGFKIIRDFKTGGEMEVFDNFEIIALNEELDYTIIKVISDREEYPYAVLQEKTLEEEKELKEFKLLGHSFGSSQMMSNAKLKEVVAKNFHLKSIGITGNSGSPLFSEDLSGVVGLYFGGFWDKKTVDIEGNVDHVSFALKISSLLRNLRVLYPEASVSSHFGLSLGDKKDFELKKDNEVEEGALNFKKALYMYPQTNWDEVERLIQEKLELSKQETNFQSLAEIQSFAQDLALLGRSLKDSRLEIPEKIITLLKTSLYYSDTDKLEQAIYPLLVITGYENQAACVREVESMMDDDTEAERFDRFYAFSSICLVSEYEEKSILKEVVSYSENTLLKEPKKFISLAKQQLEFSSYSEEDLNSFSQKFIEISHKLKIISEKYKLEGVATSLKNEKTHQEIYFQVR